MNAQTFRGNKFYFGCRKHNKRSLRLEVSSAGIDRYLSSLDDFTKYKNHNVKVKVKTTQEEEN